MKELKLGFVVNTPHAPKEHHVAERLHLLFVRILLHYCYSRDEIKWGYNLFRSGRVDTTYKRATLQSIAVRSAQKLLTDLQRSVSGVSRGEERAGPDRSWDEVMTLVASDLDWEPESDNIMFLLTSSVPSSSDRMRSVISSLIKDKKVRVYLIDTGYVEGVACPPLDREVVTQTLLGQYSREKIGLIPTEMLACEASHLWFREIFRFLLAQEAPDEAQHVRFIQKEVVVLDDSLGNSTVEYDTTFHLFPLVAKQTIPEFTSLKFVVGVCYGQVLRRWLATSALGPEENRRMFLDNCCWVVFGEKFEYEKECSFIVESQEVLDDSTATKFYFVKAFSRRIGMMYELPRDTDVQSLASKLDIDENSVDSLSFHDLTLDGDEEFSGMACTLKFRNNKLELDESSLLDQIQKFHDSNQPTSAPIAVPDQSSKDSTASESDALKDILPERARATCATEEALAQASPRYYQRSNIVSLARKHQQDIRPELRNPAKLREIHGDEREPLTKEHKIQIVLHLVWYCDFSELSPSDLETAKTGVLALLRSLSFITSPQHMHSFLQDQIVEEFHEDCRELLHDVYEEGFLMDAPYILCDDSNSLSSSILSTHMTAPLYCEDSSSQSTFGGDLPSASQSGFSRQRSWMDPNQLSQSSFSIKVPKSKSKKKKKHKEIFGRGREDPSAIAAKVCSQKQGDGRYQHLSSEITPDEARQSSKRRKFSRKNSVLDTPLKKQVKNATTAKNSRARQRVELTPQKCTTVSHIQESPVRGTNSRASSFFGSQAKPPAMRSFVMKDGFKTPGSRPPVNSSLFRSPESGSRGMTPPQDSRSQDSYRSQDARSQASSQGSFTPPGTPRAGRQMVKKLNYVNSPVRTLFLSSSNVLPSPKRKPLASDYIQMQPSPCRTLLDKENEPFFPTFNPPLDDPSQTKPLKISDALANALQPIFAPKMDENARMPSFEASPYQGTINLASSGGFLRMLEDSNLCPDTDSRMRHVSDAESDVSNASSVTSHRSILRSPYMRRLPCRRRVSFSLDLEQELQFSSDNESESSRNFSSLLNLVDGSIQNDEVEQDPITLIENVVPADIDEQTIDDIHDRRKRKRSDDADNNMA